MLYEVPSMEVVKIAGQDVITTSTIRKRITNGGAQSEPEGGYSWDSIF